MRHRIFAIRQPWLLRIAGYVPGALLASLVASSAVAQVAQYSVVNAAQDAFGTTIGYDTIGLYSDDNVRGFSPMVAGNVRLNGLYFAPQGSVSGRLIEESSIRVGISGPTDPFGAPTGIVAISLRQPGSERVVSASTFIGPFGSREMSFDAQIPISPNRLSLGIGGAVRRDEYIPGASRDIQDKAFLLQWNAEDIAKVTGFWSLREINRDKQMPLVFPSGDFSPPRFQRRYFGQEWATGNELSEVYGIVGTARIGTTGNLDAGIFRSLSTEPQSFADLLMDSTKDGIANHYLVAMAKQVASSTSGELRFSLTSEGGSYSHTTTVSIRGRQSETASKGSDTVSLGKTVVGRYQAESIPNFDFDGIMSDSTRQFATGLAYRIHCFNSLEIAASLQNVSYERAVSIGDETTNQTTQDSRLFGLEASLSLTDKTLLYLGMQRGLEEAGIAPLEATNRGEMLGASIATQQEAGIRHRGESALNLVANVFEIRKPYYSLDQYSTYREQGRETHRGLELSASKTIMRNLKVIAGVILMDAAVTQSGDSGSTTSSIRPIGLPRRFGQLSFDYQVPTFPDTSIEGVITGTGPRRARPESNFNIAGFATSDLSIRKQVRMSGSNGLLRFQVLNVANAYNWHIGSTGSFQPIEPRRFVFSLTVPV